MTEEEFDKLVAPIKSLIARKGADYNTGPTLDQYFPFGDVSYCQMIHLKALRLVSQMNVAKPNFDSRMDTVQDCIAYSVFYLAHLEKEKHGSL